MARPAVVENENARPNRLERRGSDHAGGGLTGPPETAQAQPQVPSPRALNQPSPGEKIRRVRHFNPRSQAKPQIQAKQKRKAGRHANHQGQVLPQGRPNGPGVRTIRSRHAFPLCGKCQPLFRTIPGEKRDAKSDPVPDYRQCEKQTQERTRPVLMRKADKPRARKRTAPRGEKSKKGR